MLQFAVKLCAVVCLCLVLVFSVPAQAQDVLGLPTGVSCPGFLVSRLIPNWYAVLRQNSPGSNIRSRPVIGAPIIGEVPEGERFVVWDVPVVCNNSAAWFYINYGGIEGWMVEGQYDQYWTQPLPLPDSPNTLAEFAASMPEIPVLAAPNFSAANGGDALMYTTEADPANIISIIGGTPQAVDLGGATLPTGTPVSPDGQWVVLWDGSYLQFADRATNVLSVSPDLTDLVSSGFAGFSNSVQTAPNAARVILDGQYDDGNNEIFSLERYGGNGWALINLTNSPAVDTAPQLSPDGSKIAFVSNRDGTTDIFVMDVNGANVLNLTMRPTDELLFAWSPDGEQIAFVSSSNEGSGISLANVDGSNITPVMVGLPQVNGLAWSPDGAELAYITTENDARYLNKVDLVNGGASRIAAVGFSDQPPVWAPESSFIAFTGLDGAVYVVSRGGERQRQIASEGSNIIWMPDYAPPGR